MAYIEHLWIRFPCSKEPPAREEKCEENPPILRIPLREEEDPEDAPVFRDDHHPR